MPNLISRLKFVYPFSEIARIIDLHFGQQARLFKRIDSASEAQAALSERLRLIDDAQATLLERLGLMAEAQAALSERLPQLISDAHVAVSKHLHLVSADQAACMGALEASLLALNRIEKVLADVPAGMYSQLAAIEALRNRSDELQHHVDSLAASLVVRSAVHEAPLSALSIPSGGTVPSFESLLLQYVLPFMPNNCVLDIGAGTGAFARELLEWGCEVFAFEPDPIAFRKLGVSLSKYPRFQAFPYAISREGGPTDLYVVAERTSESSVRATLRRPLNYSAVIPATARAIGELAEGETIPFSPAVIKCTTEGSEEDVIAGLGPVQAGIFLARFSDESTLPELVCSLRAANYPMFLVISYLPDGAASYYANVQYSLAGASGFVLFFRDPAVFDRAMAWCRDQLPPMRFTV